LRHGERRKVLQRQRIGEVVAATDKLAAVGLVGNFAGSG
jgi:hypothetical protein